MLDTGELVQCPNCKHWVTAVHYSEGLRCALCDYARVVTIELASAYLLIAADHTPTWGDVRWLRADCAKKALEINPEFFQND